MKNKICQASMIGFSLVLVACAPKQVSKNCDLSSSPIEGLASKSNPIQPIVQIDGTPSMQGFVNVPDSRYIRTLRLIETAAITAFENSLAVKYYSFGTKRIPLPNERSSLIAQSPSFYTSREPFLDAQIDKALESLNNNNHDHLSIIVTDLYQKDGETARVIESLKVNYLKKDLAVGILAVRSEFDGIVYDVGLVDNSFEYLTKPNNPETFHPFYLLVLGSYENVASFFDRMKAASQKQGLNFSDNQFVIFYSKLVQTPLILNIKEDNLTLKGMRRLLTVNDGNVMVSMQNRETTERLMLKDEVGRERTINYQVSYEELPYLLPVNNFSATVVTEYNNNSRNFAKYNGNQLIKFNDWQIQENELLFSTMFNYNDMDKGVYWFSAEIFPQALELPEWSSQWNLKEKESFNGSKTYNLSPFLDGLMASTLQQIKLKNQPLGRFCYLIYKP
ncbi:MAG: hypothetical protein QNJ68_22575 [Microcoleaceae cyanobacterium MO_207.B10]|nr:hypothetical protein [Microcoleaceae cyanobacterium MO_207.B10]